VVLLVSDSFAKYERWQNVESLCEVIKLVLSVFVCSGFLSFCQGGVAWVIEEPSAWSGYLAASGLAIIVEKYLGRTVLAISVTHK